MHNVSCSTGASWVKERPLKMLNDLEDPPRVSPQKCVIVHRELFSECQSVNWEFYYDFMNRLKEWVYGT